MNNVQQEIATPKACNRIHLLNAAMAAIITAGVALTVFVYSFSRLAALFMPIPAIGGMAFILYLLIKHKELKTLYLHIFFCIFAALLCAIIAFSKSEPNVIKYVMPFVFGTLVLVCAFTIFSNRQNRLMSATSVYQSLMSLAAILCIYFSSHVTSGYKIFVWGEKTIEISFGAFSLTVWGVAVFCIAAIFLAKSLFVPVQNSKVSTKYITYTAMLSAMSVVFKILGNSISNMFPNPYMKLTFVYIPWVISGIVLGPVGGMVSAGVGDLLGQILLPNGGAWFWLTWISNFLIPVFPALTFMLIKAKKQLNWLLLLIGMSISTLVCTMGLGTLAMCLQWDMKFFPTLYSRLPQLIIIAINYGLIVSLLPVIENLKIKRLKLYETG